MPFNFSSPEYLSHHYRTRKYRVSPVSRASPAHEQPLIGAVHMSRASPVYRADSILSSLMGA